MILGKDLIVVLFVIPNQAYDILTGLLLGQDILFTWCYLYNLTRLGNPVWTLYKVLAIGTLFAIANIIASWMSMSEQASDDSNVLIWCQTVLAVAFFILFVVIGQWIHYLWKKIDESTDMLTLLKTIQTSVFILFFLFYLLADWGPEFVPSANLAAEWNTFGLNYLTMMVYMMTGCTAIVSVISGRVSKLGSMIFSNAHEVLAVRKMFMRYISHEMRTPLNTVCVGLNVLTKQLQNAFNIATDHSCFVTLKDVQSSCEIAVSVLNDMLLYDKIESGLMSLELAIISPWSLIKQSVELFYIQVRFS